MQFSRPTTPSLNAASRQIASTVWFEAAWELREESPAELRNG
jgi:hypothetical protein